jgi:tetratricopeptide (TPR) repeat protein
MIRSSLAQITGRAAAVAVGLLWCLTSTVQAQSLACEAKPEADSPVDAALETGRYRDLAELAAGRMETLGTCESALLRAHIAIERHDWTATVGVNPADCADEATVLLWYARGLAAARAIGRSENLAALPAARESLAKLEAAAGTAGPYSAPELRRIVLMAAIVASQDEREELKILLTHGAALAARLSDRCAASFGELAGDLWLQVDRYEDARRAYTAALRLRPTRARIRLGLARAASRLGDFAGAVSNYRAFLHLWRTADPDLPEIAEANEFVERHAQR